MFEGGCCIKLGPPKPLNPETKAAIQRELDSPLHQQYIQGKLGEFATFDFFAETSSGLEAEGAD